MFSLDHKDFDDRLAELNCWQIEQQKKLKTFQEAQRKLLDLEHQNVLNSLSIQTFKPKSDRTEDVVSNNECKKHETGKKWNQKKFEDKESSDTNHVKFEPIKLKEQNSSLTRMQSCSSQKDAEHSFYYESMESKEEKESGQPKKFLKRGDGLARFRMKLEDFKGPPKIYKEKRIKTYLNNKSLNTFKKINKPEKPSKMRNKGNLNFTTRMPKKSLAVPVKIYVSENKMKKCNSLRISNKVNQGDLQQDCKTANNINLPKTLSQNLIIKSSEWCETMKENKHTDHRSEALNSKVNCMVETYPEVDIEKKKDEKELKIFEILEQKVDDSSFCSTSSFIDKLMDQSMSSMPSTSFTKNKKSYQFCNNGLKSLSNQFVSEEQIQKFEDFDDFPSGSRIITDNPNSENVKVSEDLIVTQCGYAVSDLKAEREDGDEYKKETEKDTVLGNQESESFLRNKKQSEITGVQKANKTLLQEFIKDFKKFKYVLAENDHKYEEHREETLPKDLLDKEKEKQLEIDLKLQRKGLQDNVKQLLNWECPPRKKQQKKTTKKAKPKSVKTEKLKAAEKVQSEKVIFNSSLLKTRLDELEREINIFRRENRNLEKLQKDCNEERSKLAKDKKQFEKEIQEEKEKLEAKISEENKKLQREKNVFEKYCKQVKNQPSRQEREEIVSLKKELEKLTDTLATKESRWGASQARLRNQIKNLEKENIKLKTENENLKKLSLKKVTFEGERNINTKIIHAINYELEKLKPTMVKNVNDPVYTKRHPSSARDHRRIEENPIRRVKSTPNIKKQFEMDGCFERSKENDEKVLGSVSTDSGIETNGSRHVRSPKLNEITLSDILPNRKLNSSKLIARARSEELPTQHRSTSHICGQLCNCTASGNSSESSIKDCTESITEETLFDNCEIERMNITVGEVKKSLKEPHLLKVPEQGGDSRSVRLMRLWENTSSNCKNTESDDVNDYSMVENEEEQSEGEKKNSEFEITDYCEKKNVQGKRYFLGNSENKNCPIGDNRESNGIRERILEDGAKEICYPNGNVKKIFPGNNIVKMVYYNGDVKEMNIAEGSEKYFYAETKTWHTTYKDGLEVLEFPNGQTERRHANGSTEIAFPNGCVRYCDAFGRDEWRFLDGTVIKRNKEGHKILLMPNGQREIHTKEFKRREYPDGTVKILYVDGSQETRYAFGRVRLKDKDGNLVMDSGGIR